VLLLLLMGVILLRALVLLLMLVLVLVLLLAVALVLVAVGLRRRLPHLLVTRRLRALVQVLTPGVAAITPIAPVARTTLIAVPELVLPGALLPTRLARALTIVLRLLLVL
jgi:hypothetical protein